MKKSFVTILFVLMLSFVSYGVSPKYKSGSSSAEKNVGNIIPQKPTHFFFSPTLDVSDAFGMVLSPREISLGLGSNFMVYLSPWNGRIPDSGDWASIGNARAGAKYKINDIMTFAGGVDFYNGGSSGLGLSLVYNISKDDFNEFDIIPKGRIGINNMSHQVGIDFGILKGMNKLFSLMAEPGFRMEFKSENDTTYTSGFIELNGGLRIVPPSFPLVYFDLGGNFDWTIFGDSGNYGGLYIDFGFCFKP